MCHSQRTRNNRLRITVDLVEASSLPLAVPLEAEVPAGNGFLNNGLGWEWNY